MLTADDWNKTTIHGIGKHYLHISEVIDGVLTATTAQRYCDLYHASAIRELGNNVDYCYWCDKIGNLLKNT